jgi:hypothetical protein
MDNNIYILNNNILFLIIINDKFDNNDGLYLILLLRQF